MCKKKCVKFKFEDYKNCPEATQLENKIGNLGKMKLRQSQKRLKRIHKKVINQY